MKLEGKGNTATARDTGAVSQVIAKKQRCQNSLSYLAWLNIWNSMNVRDCRLEVHVCRGEMQGHRMLDVAEAHADFRNNSRNSLLLVLQAASACVLLVVQMWWSRLKNEHVGDPPSLWYAIFINGISELQTKSQKNLWIQVPSCNVCRYAQCDSGCWPTRSTRTWQLNFWLAIGYNEQIGNRCDFVEGIPRRASASFGSSSNSTSSLKLRFGRGVCMESWHDRGANEDDEDDDDDDEHVPSAWEIFEVAM